MLYLGRFYTVEVTIAPGHRLIDSGPYRYIRHPAYAGALLAFFGLGMAMGNAASVIAVLLPLAIALRYRIHVEETVLRETLGARYLTYMRRTKKLIPLIF